MKIRILFIASGNKKFGSSPFVNAQAESLKNAGVDILFFPVKGRGWRGYFTNIKKLRNIIKETNPDVIHAHYSHCGLLAVLSTRKPIITSILGSFPKKTFKLILVRFLSRYLWKATIVKSQRTANQLGIKNLHILPNGVNLSIFNPVDYKAAREICGFDDKRKYVIFLSNPDRPEKNYHLAEKSVCELKDNSVKLLPVFDKKQGEVVIYMSAADVLLMTSLSEGSPNVIKEAMACNCPIVTTDCGDVNWITNGVEGCYVAKSYDEKEISSLIKKALVFDNRTCGREQIKKLGLTSEQIAARLIKIYSSNIK